MRESKWERRRLRIQQDPQKKIIVEGVIGRCGVPTINRRVYSRSIMEREIKKLRVEIRERWKRGLTDQDPTDVLGSDMTAMYEESSLWTRHDNGMEAMAEACCSPDEVKAIVLPFIERAFLKAKKTHASIREARNLMHIAAYKFLGEHYYVLPQKKATIERWSKRYLKGYQKWWRRVSTEEKRIRRKHEKNGTSAGSHSLVEALHLVSPELFAMTESCA